MALTNGQRHRTFQTAQTDQTTTAAVAEGLCGLDFFGGVSSPDNKDGQGEGSTRAKDAPTPSNGTLGDMIP